MATIAQVGLLSRRARLRRVSDRSRPTTGRDLQSRIIRFEAAQSLWQRRETDTPGPRNPMQLFILGLEKQMARAPEECDTGLELERLRYECCRRVANR